MKGNYENGIARLMGGDIDLINDQIVCALIDLSIYTPDLANDKTLADVTEAALISERDLTGKTLDDTTFRADNSVHQNIPNTEPEIGALLIFKNTGDLNTSYLIYFDDEATGFPITPDGTDVTLEWDLGANGIFKV